MTTWSGGPCPIDPDNCWIDDETGEHVNAKTGTRSPASIHRVCGLCFREFLNKEELDNHLAKDHLVVKRR